MPHIIVKLYAGRSPEVKAQLSEAITEAVVKTIGSAPGNVSIAMQDIPADEWADMYRRDILEGSIELIKKPGYNPFD